MELEAAAQEYIHRGLPLLSGCPQSAQGCSSHSLEWRKLGPAAFSWVAFCGEQLVTLWTVLNPT